MNEPTQKIRERLIVETFSILEQHMEALCDTESTDYHDMVLDINSAQKNALISVIKT